MATLPDGRGYPGTLAALRIEQLARVEEIEDRLYSVRRAVPMLGWLVLTGLTSLTAIIVLSKPVGASDDLPAFGFLVFVAVWAVVGRVLGARRWFVRHPVGVLAGVACWVVVGVLVSGRDASDLLVRSVCVVVYLLVVGATMSRMAGHAARGRAMRREVLRWLGVDRTTAAVALPAGVLEPGDRTIGRISRVIDDKLLKVLMLSLIPGCLGGVFAAMPFVGPDLVEPVWLRPVTALGGLVMFTPMAVLLWANTAESFRRQGRQNQGTVGAQVARAQHAALSGTPVPEPGGNLSRRARAALVMVVVVLVLALIVRVAAAALVALVMVTAILVLAAATAALWLLRRRRLHVVPLRGYGPGVLDHPAKRVRLDLDQAGLHLVPVRDDAQAATIERDDILDVVAIKLGYPFAPPAVGIITDGIPTVLAGHHASDHPAITALREHAVADRGATR